MSTSKILPTEAFFDKLAELMTELESAEVDRESMEDIGICKLCGHEQFAVEPDATSNLCDECEQPSVVSVFNAINRYY